MTKNDIIKMAHEAGFADGVAEIVGLEGFANFANLVAKHEREECAKVAFDGYDQRFDGDEIGAAIRARGNT
jgi:hypothetical protein